MALPKNKRGFRKITVEGQNFHWRLADVIDIRSGSQKDNKLRVDFGWYNKWLYLNDDEENTPPDYEPEVVTPAFVREAILFAIACEWDSLKRVGLMQLKYRNGKFEINAHK